MNWNKIELEDHLETSDVIVIRKIRITIIESDL